jgi:hypothetical protein
VFPQLVEEEGAERHVVDYRSVALRVSEDDATVVVLPGMLFAPRVMRSVAMQERTVIERVEILERNVELFEALPARVSALESQIVQLRSEMRDEFAAVRGEMRAGFLAVRDEFAAVRGEMRAGFLAVRDEFAAVRGEMHAGFLAARDEFSAVRGEMAGMRDSLLTVLRAEIREGDEETRRYMRVLHEDLVARIALLQKGRPPRKKA